MAGEFGNSDAAGSASRKYSECKQGERSDARCAKAISRRSTTLRGPSEISEPLVLARGFLSLLLKLGRKTARVGAWPANYRAVGMLGGRDAVRLA